MEENTISQQEYIEKVVGAYRQTPTTMGTVRPADRLVAAHRMHEAYRWAWWRTRLF